MRRGVGRWAWRRWVRCCCRMQREQRAVHVFMYVAQRPESVYCRGMRECSCSYTSVQWLQCTHCTVGTVDMAMTGGEIKAVTWSTAATTEVASRASHGGRHTAWASNGCVWARLRAGARGGGPVWGPSVGHQVCVCVAKCGPPSVGPPVWVKLVGPGVYMSTRRAMGVRLPKLRPVAFVPGPA